MSPARYSTDLVVFDLEASSPDDGDNEVERSNIIEIGAVRLSRKDLAVVDSFSELVRPRDWPILPHIRDLTGITPEMVAGCELFDAVGRRFVEWYGARNRSVLAAFGVYYDLPLLRKECRTFGIPFSEHFVGGALDVRSLGMAWLAEHGRSTTGITLPGILERMGISIGVRERAEEPNAGAGAKGPAFRFHLGLNAHRALDDAKAAAAMLQMVHLGTVRIQADRSSSADRTAFTADPRDPDASPSP